MEKRSVKVWQTRNGYMMKLRVIAGSKTAVEHAVLFARHAAMSTGCRIQVNALLVNGAELSRSVVFEASSKLALAELRSKLFVHQVNYNNRVLNGENDANL